MSALSGTLAEKVGKIIGQFGSDNPNVQTTAVAALRRVLTANGCGLSDLSDHITAPPREVVIYRDRPEPQRAGPRDYGDWRRAWQGADPRRRHKTQVARVRAAPPGFLSPWEVEFTGSLARQLDQGRALSCRQETILRDLYVRLEERFA